MSDIDKALALMLEAHAGQVDKSGEPYVLHPLRVMMRLSGPDERMAALLHDAVEDSEISLQRLREEGFSPEVVGAVEALTKRPGEDYEAFIERVTRNPLAIRVKIADLQDNIDVTRLREVGEDDLARVQKYHRALSVLRPLGREKA
jgi:(p)ppGpp synthase/HD superfamily hydrolase